MAKGTRGNDLEITTDAALGVALAKYCGTRPNVDGVFLLDLLAMPPLGLIPHDTRNNGQPPHWFRNLFAAENPTRSAVAAINRIREAFPAVGDWPGPWPNSFLTVDAACGVRSGALVEIGFDSWDYLRMFAQRKLDDAVVAIDGWPGKRVLGSEKLTIIRDDWRNVELLAPEDLAIPWLILLDPYTYILAQDFKNDYHRMSNLTSADLSKLEPVIRSYVESGQHGAVSMLAYGMDVSTLPRFVEDACACCRAAGAVSTGSWALPVSGKRHAVVAASTEPGVLNDLESELSRAFGTALISVS